VGRDHGRRRARLLVVLFLLWSVAAMVAAAPASAHAELEETAPAAGSVVPAAPSQVSVTFSEPVTLSLGRIVVMGPDGHPAQAGPPTTGTGDQVLVPLRHGLGRGTYLVSYRVVSADGHPVAGGFTFSIIAPSPLADIVPAGAADAAVEPWVRALVSAARYAGYAGLVLIAGALVLATALRRAALPLVEPRRLARWGYAALGGGTVLAIVVNVPYASGAGLTDVTWNALGAQFATTGQQAYVARLAMLLVAWPLVRDVTAGHALGAGERISGVLLAVAVFATWPLAGHAGTGGWWPLTTVTELAHVAAMAVWAGGLVAVLRCLLPASRPPGALRALLAVWPRWAAGAVVVLVASGVVQAAVQTGSVRAVTGTFYGHLLLAKAAGTAGMLAAAAFAHRTVTRRFPGPPSQPAGPPPVTRAEPADVTGRSGGASVQVRTPVRPESDGGTARLRRAVTVEILVAVVVVALATALVQATPGRVAARRLVGGGALLLPPSPGEPVYGIERAAGLTLQVDMAPLQVGRNTMLMTLIDDAGQPVTPAKWTVEVAMPSRDIRNVSVPVDTTMGTGVAYVLPQLSVPGDWSFTITVLTEDLDTVVMQRSVRVY
jgi:copper transport protein